MYMTQLSQPGKASLYPSSVPPLVSASHSCLELLLFIHFSDGQKPISQTIPFLTYIAFGSYFIPVTENKARTPVIKAPLQF